MGPALSWNYITRPNFFQRYRDQMIYTAVFFWGFGKFMQFRGR